MVNLFNNKSVVDTYTKNALILLVLSAITIGGLIGFFSVYEFIQDSKNLEQENFSLGKATIQREVSRVETLIKFERSKLDALIRKNIKDRVYEAHTIATKLYEKYKDTKQNNELKTLIIEALRPQRFFENRGYFYAISLDGIGMLNPITPQFEGTNLLPFKTRSGDFYIKELINIAKNSGEGFYDHTWTKPDKKGVFDKVSFVKHFKPFNWLIGTGDYVIDVERQIKTKILEQIGKIRFDNEGYIFVVNYDGIVMMNTGQPSIIGKNIINVTDANDVRVAHEIIKLAQNPNWDGYFKYSWAKRSTAEASPKIAFHKTIPEWRWYYGTGIYTDEINSTIEKKRDTLKERLLLQLILIITIITAAVSILFYISKKSSAELDNDLGQLLSFFEFLSIKSKSINPDKLKYSEFKQLAQSANMMLKKQQESEAQRIKYEEQLLQNQKMTAANQMVGGISHDFNNLLASILGYGELLELKLGDNGNQDLMKYAHQINVAGKRGAKLTKKLLSLTRQKNVDTESCNLNTILREEEDLLKKSLTAKIQLKINLKENLWPVLINKNDFEDVILNLCVNAMHAMHSGQQDSEIIISTDHIQISDSEFSKYDLPCGEYVLITVSDNGMGMDDEIKERIFEPFFTTRDTGHGLGLSQVYSFAKQNHGTILVESTKDIGSKFEIIIPHDLSTHDSSKIEDLSDKSDFKGNATILVVDDESALRELSTNILSQEGYRVLQAENGIEALAVLEEEDVDLVLSDIIMPIMDGNILAEKIRQLYPQIKIQLISGYVKPDNSSKNIQDLHEYLLSKPFKAADLLRRIKLLLNS